MSSPKTGVDRLVRRDPPHYMDRDRNPRSRRIVSLVSRLPDAGLHHCVGGNNGACRTQPSHRQSRVGTRFSGSSRNLHAIPTGSVFPRIRIHIRPGDSGALRGFAIAAQKIAHAERLNPAARKIVIHPGGIFNQREQEEFLMSSMNGDKSRYHRARKQKIARRKRTRELLERAATPVKPVNSPRAVTA